MLTGGDDIVEAGWQVGGAVMDSLDALEACVAAPDDEERRQAAVAAVDDLDTALGHLQSKLRIDLGLTTMVTIRVRRDGTVKIVDSDKD